MLRPFEPEPECAKCGAFVEEIFYTEDREFIDSRQRNGTSAIFDALVLPCSRCGYQDCQHRVKTGHLPPAES